MVTYTKATGSAGTMRIDDDGTDNVDLYLLGVNQAVDQVPWAYTLNGQTVGWRSFNLEANLAWQKLGTLWVGTSQTITFKLGASGNVKLGGPTDFSLDVKRADVVAGGSGFVDIVVNGVHKNAIPFVNDQGIWKQAAPWGKLAGEWSPTA